MSRLSDFLQPTESRVEDVVSMFEVEGVTVKQYRRSTSGTNPGFQTEIGNYALKRTLQAIVKVAKSRRSIRKSKDFGDVVKTEYLMVCHENDILPDDKMVVDEKEYIVREADVSLKGFTEAIMEAYG